MHPKLFVGLTHGVGMVVIALIVVAFQGLVHGPMQARQVEADKRVAQLRELLKNSIEVRRRHVELKGDLDRLAERIEGSRELTPATSKESEFLSVASQVAQRHGLEIVDYRRGKVRRLPAHSEIDITLSGVGGHRSICGFLAEMEQTPRAKKVRRLQIDSSGSPDAYPVEVAYTLYFGLGSPAQAAVSPTRTTR
ncbi:MAG: hypothetical protein AAF790_13725 [Planctomycetota bacterium]